MYESYLSEFQGIMTDSASVFHKNVEGSVDEIAIGENGKTSTIEMATGPMDRYVQSLSLSDRLASLSSSMEKVGSSGVQLPPPIPSPSSHHGYTSSLPSSYYPSISCPSEDLGMWKNPPSTGRSAWADQLTTGDKLLLMK